MLAVCQPSEDDRVLLARLLSHQQTSTSSSDDNADVGLSYIRQNEDLIRLLLITWLRQDSGVEAHQADMARVFAVAQHLSSQLVSIHYQTAAANSDCEGYGHCSFPSHLVWNHS